MAEDIQGLGALLRRLNQLATDTRHVEAPLKAAGAVMLGSVEKNFRAQGRPVQWEPLAGGGGGRRRDGRGRYSKGKAGRRRRGKILIDKARLKNSISYRLVTAGVEVGTNVIYARRHHFGYEGGEGRGRSRTPARPFLLIHDEDIRDIGEIFRRHVEKK